MRHSVARPLLAATAVLLAALPQALAHGHDGHGESSMDVNMAAGAGGGNANATIPAPPPGPESYLAHPPHAGLMFAHIAFMTLAWVLVLPIGVVLSIARSRLTLFIQLSFLVLNALGVAVGAVYNAHTPDLYPHNAHHTLGWIVTWVALAQALISLVGLYARRGSHSQKWEGPYVPVSAEAMAEHHRVHWGRDRDREPQVSRWSNDSGQGSEMASTVRDSTNSPTRDYDSQDLPSPRHFHDDEDHSEDGDEHVDEEKRGFLRNTAVDRFLSRKLPSLFSSRALRLATWTGSVIDRLILVLGFMAMTTGLVAYGGIFRGRDVFNGLAHFIKGGIFFWYGLLTLGRWMGCFADLGWAWNVRLPASIVGRRKAALPSAEFVESFVIFFYGSTNVFLEHLAAWGKPWAPQDLEHVSISIMFFGGGLCGMLVESRKIRDLLNTSTILTRPVARFNDFPFRPNVRARSDPDLDLELDLNGNGQWDAPRSYATSLNPIPGLIILLLGIMMSSHHQDSMVSTMVHKQWGTLLVGFSFARAVTYILMYLSPPTSHLPSRPPSELIAAFCLISGGLVFMASNRNTVQAMEKYELDAMFVFTVTMGGTALLMAWGVCVLALKGWAVRREAGGPDTFLGGQHPA